MLTNKNRQEICEALRTHCKLEMTGRDAQLPGGQENDDWFDTVYLYYAGDYSIQIKIDDAQLMCLLHDAHDNAKESWEQLEHVLVSAMTLEEIQAFVAKDDDS